jgi:iron complex outermembrane receptor protein
MNDMLLALMLALASPGAASSAAAGEVRGTLVAAHDRHPLAGATVTLVDLQRSATADADGRFRLADVPLGTVSLRASALGYMPAVTTLTVTAGLTQVELSLAAETRFSEEVVVTASGSPETARRLPYSIGVIGRDELAVNRGVALSEVLNAVPGVKAESQAETQEVRLSIRGRGVRTAFGVRSVRLLYDGIPESDSTGETADLTGIDMGAVERIEVVKGPMSAQYGASSSGVVNLVTAPVSATPVMEAKLGGGSYDFLKSDLGLAGPVGPLRARLNLSRTAQDGYRDHSLLRAYRGTARVSWPLGEDSELSFLGRLTRSESELPGNLSADDVAADRRQASALFTAFDARSDIDRALVGARFTKRWSGERELALTVFGHDTSFEVPVPFVFLAGDRLTGGTSARYSFPLHLGGLANSVLVGADAQWSKEDRQDFANESGVRGSAMFRDEDRRLSNVGIFVMDTLELTRRTTLRAGLNLTRVGVELDDFILEDGNDSGQRDFDQLSYQLALSHRFHDRFTLFLTNSSGFDPPTISEIGRNPDGGGGLHPTLEPETSMNFELGALIEASSRLSFRLGAFRLKVNDEIIPTGTGFPQEVFRNAAETLHQGIEASASLSPLRGLKIVLGYTYSDFDFTRYETEVGDFSGNRIPGIPEHNFHGQVGYSAGGFRAGLTWRNVGHFFADDANQVVNPHYQVVDLHAGGERALGKAVFSLTVRANNLFDELYSDYVVINDRFGGYFYPSAERNIAASLSVRVPF